MSSILDYDEIKNVNVETLKNIGFKEHIVDDENIVYIKEFPQYNIEVSYYPKESWKYDQKIFRIGIGYIDSSGLKMKVKDNFWVTNDYKVKCLGKIEFFEILDSKLNKIDKIFQS